MQNNTPSPQPFQSNLLPLDSYPDDAVSLLAWMRRVGRPVWMPLGSACANMAITLSAGGFLHVASDVLNGERGFFFGHVTAEPEVGR